MSHLLDNYKQLASRVDALCATITEALGERITCSEGCSSCCTAITIFPVEAAAMLAALNNLPEPQAEEIRRYVLEHAGKERCPLLSHHRCLLYDARPIICRTHGLPIVYDADGERKSDCCPLNLTDNAPLSGTNVVDLDKLNTLLVAVNSIYLAQADSTNTGTRVAIAEAIKQK